MASKEPIRVYTLDEVAEVLKITRRTLYTYVKEGKLKAVKIGREWRVSETALQGQRHRGIQMSRARRRLADALTPTPQ